MLLASSSAESAYMLGLTLEKLVEANPKISAMLPNAQKGPTWYAAPACHCRPLQGFPSALLLTVHHILSVRNCSRYHPKNRQRWIWTCHIA